jgi:hypothetical protein
MTKARTVVPVACERQDRIAHFQCIAPKECGAKKRLVIVKQGFFCFQMRVLRHNFAGIVRVIPAVVGSNHD